MQLGRDDNLQWISSHPGCPRHGLSEGPARRAHQRPVFGEPADEPSGCCGTPGRSPKHRCFRYPSRRILLWSWPMASDSPSTCRFGSQNAKLGAERAIRRTGEPVRAEPLSGDPRPSARVGATDLGQRNLGGAEGALDVLSGNLVRPAATGEPVLAEATRRSSARRRPTSGTRWRAGRRSERC